MYQLHFSLASLLFVILAGNAGAQRSVSPGQVGPQNSRLPVMVEELSISCVPAIRDLAGTGCLSASTTPLLGSLYPLSMDLFVSPSGAVGLGTLAPLERLHVRGGAFLEGSLRFDEVTEGIEFSSDFLPIGLPSVPMMRMFVNGTSNADRMVLAHSNSFSSWGLEYQDSGDEFVFQRSTSDPVLTVDLGGREVAVANGARLSVGEPSPTAGLHVTVAGPSARLETSSIVAGQAVVESVGQFLNPAVVDLFRGFQPGFPSSNTAFRVTNYGNVYADGAYTGPADFAEMLVVSTGADSVAPGDLLVIDPDAPNCVRRSASAHSTLVCGVYSTDPGFVGSTRAWDEELPGEPTRRLLLDRGDMAERYNEVPVAVVGIVPVRASAENGSIAVGDLLVSSSTEGHVMRAGAPKIGTVVGKALEPLTGGLGSIRVLVTLQ